MNELIPNPQVLYVVARGKAVGRVENRPVKPSSTSRLALIQVDKLPSTGIEHTIEAAQFGPRDGGGKSCKNGT